MPWKRLRKHRYKVMLTDQYFQVILTRNQYSKNMKRTCLVKQKIKNRSDSLTNMIYTYQRPKPYLYQDLTEDKHGMHIYTRTHVRDHSTVPVERGFTFDTN